MWDSRAPNATRSEAVLQTLPCIFPGLIGDRTGQVKLIGEEEEEDLVFAEKGVYCSCLTLAYEELGDAPQNFSRCFVGRAVRELEYGTTRATVTK